MIWQPIKTMDGYTAYIPNDSNGDYCPICACLMGEHCCYFPDGMPNFQIICPVCLTSFGKKDVPSKINGNYIPYLDHIQTLRREWLECEAYGESALNQIYQAFGVIVDVPVQIDSSPWLVRWNKQTAGPFVKPEIVGNWQKHILNLETPRYLIKSSSNDNPGWAWHRSHPKQRAFDKILSNLTSNPDEYLESPPVEAVWK